MCSVLIQSAMGKTKLSTDSDYIMRYIALLNALIYLFFNICKTNRPQNKINETCSCHEETSMKCAELFLFDSVSQTN